MSILFHPITVCAPPFFFLYTFLYPPLSFQDQVFAIAQPLI